MQFPREACALGRRRPPPQPVQQVNVIHCRAHLPDQIQQKSQFLQRLAAPERIEQKYPAPPLTPGMKRDCYERLERLPLSQLRNGKRVWCGHGMTALIESQSL